MAQRKKSSSKKTVYLCTDGAEIVGAASTLPRLVKGTNALGAKSYYIYYRNLSNRNEFYYANGAQNLKIQRLSYD